MEVEPVVEARLDQVDEVGGGDGHPNIFETVFTRGRKVTAR